MIKRLSKTCCTEGVVDIDHPYPGAQQVHGLVDGIFAWADYGMDTGKGVFVSMSSEYLRGKDSLRFELRDSWEGSMKKAEGKGADHLPCHSPLI